MPVSHKSDAATGVGRKHFLHLSLALSANVLGAPLGADIGRHLGLEVVGGGYEVRLHVPGRGSIGEEALYHVLPQLRLRYPRRDGRLVPYLIGGVGLGYAEFNDRKPVAAGFPIQATSYGVAASLGAGLEYGIASNIAVGLEARYLTSRGHTVRIGDDRAHDTYFDALILTMGLRVYVLDLRLKRGLTGQR
jgi:hypothetical protein